MVILWLLFGPIQPQQLSWQFLHLLNGIQSHRPWHHSVLPPHKLYFPSRHREPGQMPKWQLSCLYKSNAHVFICCSEVVMYKLWGIRTLHVLRGVCDQAALGTLRCSSGILDSGYRWQLVRCLYHTPWGFFSVCKSVCDC